MAAAALREKQRRRCENAITAVLCTAGRWPAARPEGLIVEMNGADAVGKLFTLFFIKDGELSVLFQRF